LLSLPLLAQNLLHYYNKEVKMREKILLSLFFLWVFMIFKCKGRGLLSPDFRKDGSIADEEKIPIKIECTLASLITRQSQ
jgi:hypothetical protein